uniref:Uncharacterized protein n=1 Tax=Avena sativa TaxID=4498 RepID=A0ACD5Z894_AVESA
MQSHCTKPFKQAFLKNLLLSHQLLHESSFGGAMSLHERKLAVKSSAEVAMAAARGGGARWPKAIMSGACKVRRCRKIAIRCHGHQGSRRDEGRGDVASRVVVRRTMALRKVIPGGQDASVDEATLLREAMDYVVHLRAQVDVLRRVSQAVQRSSSSILVRGRP